MYMRVYYIYICTSKNIYNFMGYVFILWNRHIFHGIYISHQQQTYRLTSFGRCERQQKTHNHYHSSYINHLDC